MPTQQQPKPKKPGRPKLPTGVAMGKAVRIRMSPDNLKRMSAAAKAKKLSVSEWIRSTLEANLNA